MSIFEQAARAKLRFETSKGLMSTEDLWDLPLTSQTGKPNLDDIARGLNRQLKESADVSFVTAPSTEDATIKLKFEVVKHVIGVRLADNQAAAQASVNKERRTLIANILEQKQQQELLSKSPEELKAMLEKL